MTKKKMTAIISLIVGGVILSSAALANFATSNGYNMYKESIRKIFDQDNYTLKMTVEVKVDDEQLLGGDFAEQYDKASGAYVKKENSYDKTNSDRSQSSYETYYQDGLRITRYSPEYDSETGTYKENGTYHVDDVYMNKNPSTTFSKESFGDFEDGELFDKYFNFASSCVDLFVGDIKNNFVLMGAQDGLSTYEANLDLFQIPEVVNSGADLIVSQVRKDLERRRSYSDYKDDFDSYVEKFMFDPFISGAKCTVTVDDEGRLVNNVLSAEISGKDENGTAHKMAVKFDISFSDYGTTVPEKIDIDGKNTERASNEIRTRIAELNKLLADDDLSKDERENYKSELKKRTRVIEEFDKNGMIDREKFYARGRVVETAPAAETEEAEEAAEAEKAEDAEVNKETSEAEAASVGIIGGADGPTAVYVAQ